MLRVNRELLMYYFSQIDADEIRGKRHIYKDRIIICGDHPQEARWLAIRPRKFLFQFLNSQVGRSRDMIKIL